MHDDLQHDGIEQHDIHVETYVHRTNILYATINYQ